MLTRQDYICSGKMNMTWKEVSNSSIHNLVQTFAQSFHIIEVKYV